MKILFSVYNENFETEESESLCHQVVQTNMTIAEIDKLLQMHEGFRSVLEVGYNVCFWDIYCFFENTDELLERIYSIPINKSERKKLRFPEVLVIKRFDPRNAEDAFYPNEKDCFAYRVTRYELGASSFETIVMFASNHPWLMVFIGGAIWDFTKFLFSKFMKRILRKESNVKHSENCKTIVCFSVRKFYQNFSQITKIPEKECQIVLLSKRKNNSFYVRIRTVGNQCFSVECTNRGKVISIKPVDVKILHREEL